MSLDCFIVQTMDPAPPKLYRLSESQAQAAALVGVDDIERRQHVQQLTQRVLAGCRQASQPFTWIRAAGLRSIAAALSVGLEDGQALTAVLEATYSQVLEVILSALDRDLIPTAPAVAAAYCEQQQQHSHSSSGSEAVDVSELLSAVGRYPAGYAPAAASSDELQEAFRVLQALCLLQPKARRLLCKAQYLQLVTARACEAPACLPAAMNTLLTLLQGSEEAQGLFVSTGGLDMLLARTLQHLRQQPHSPTDADSSASGSSSGVRLKTGGGGSSSSGGAVLVDGCDGLSRRELAVQLLLFLQLLEQWVLAHALKAGAHPSTQRAALALVVNHLGPDVAAAISHGPAAAARSSAGGSSSTAAAARASQAGAAEAAAGDKSVWSSEQLLQDRAEAAADKLLRALQ